MLYRGAFLTNCLLWPYAKCPGWLLDYFCRRQNRYWWVFWGPILVEATIRGASCVSRRYTVTQVLRAEALKIVGIITATPSIFVCRFVCDLRSVRGLRRSCFLRWYIGIYVITHGQRCLFAWFSAFTKRTSQRTRVASLCRGLTWSCAINRNTQAAIRNGNITGPVKSMKAADALFLCVFQKWVLKAKTGENRLFFGLCVHQSFGFVVCYFLFAISPRTVCGLRKLPRNAIRGLLSMMFLVGSHHFLLRAWPLLGTATTTVTPFFEP